MQYKSITPKYHVSKPLIPELIPRLVRDGFAKIICNLPDGEIPDAINSETVRDLAIQAGLEFEYIPITVTKITPEIVLRHTNAVLQTDGAVFAYCATGRLCTMLWALEFCQKKSHDDILARTMSAGFDLTSMRNKLETFTPLPSKARP